MERASIKLRIEKHPAAAVSRRIAKDVNEEARKPGGRRQREADGKLPASPTREFFFLASWFPDQAQPIVAAEPSSGNSLRFRKALAFDLAVYVQIIHELINQIVCCLSGESLRRREFVRPIRAAKVAATRLLPFSGKREPLGERTAKRKSSATGNDGSFFGQRSSGEHGRFAQGEAGRPGE